MHAKELRDLLIAILPCCIGAATIALLIVNALVVERPHDPTEREPQAPDKSSHADQHGLIHQCCHCRRVQNQKIKHRWDWVPQWVDHVPRETSHTLCPLCLDYYYPEDEIEDERLSSDT